MNKNKGLYEEEKIGKEREQIRDPQL